MYGPTPPKPAKKLDATCVQINLLSPWQKQMQ